MKCTFTSKSDILFGELKAGDTFVTSTSVKCRMKLDQPYGGTKNNTVLFNCVDLVSSTLEHMPDDTPVFPQAGEFVHYDRLQ